jgi:hypothetical protein
VYAFTQDVPIDEQFYRDHRRPGDAVPNGLRVHLAIAPVEGGLRYIDVWETERTVALPASNVCTRLCT